MQNRYKWTAVSIASVCLALTTSASAQTAPPPTRTALHFQLGQSNAVGLAPVGEVPAPLDFSTGPRPIQELQLFQGAGQSAQYRLRNLRYLPKTSDTAIDKIEGSIAGQRGETVIDFDTSATTVAVSSFIGVAERITADNASGSSLAILFKVARGGTPLSSQDPQAVQGGGGVYKNGRRAITGWLRGFVDGEVKAGRSVDLQMVELDQGEREAALARNAGNLSHPAMLAWANTLRTRIYPYYVEKYGVTFPLMVRQLLPIRVANNPNAPLDPYTDAQNKIEESVCRYTVTINDDGSIRTVIDNGASPTRLPNAYFLKHDRTDASLADVHAGYQLSRLFGIAKVNLQRYLDARSPGLAGRSIKRIAPVIMTYSASESIGATIPVTIFVDEVARVHFLAVAANSRPPTVANLIRSGRSVMTAVDVNGNGWPQTFSISGLAASTAYDIYAVAIDPRYGHAGSVLRVASNVTTGLF